MARLISVLERDASGSLVAATRRMSSLILPSDATATMPTPFASDLLMQLALLPNAADSDATEDAIKLLAHVRKVNSSLFRAMAEGAAKKDVHAILRATMLLCTPTGNAFFAAALLAGELDLISTCWLAGYFVHRYWRTKARNTLPSNHIQPIYDAARAATDDTLTRLCANAFGKTITAELAVLREPQHPTSLAGRALAEILEAKSQTPSNAPDGVVPAVVLLLAKVQRLPNRSASDNADVAMAKTLLGLSTPAQRNP